MFDRYAVERALDGSGLSSTERAVLWALLSYADMGGSCWPSVEAIALRSGASRATVQRSLRSLEVAGWLEVGSRNGTSSVYQIRQGGPHSEAGRGLTVRQGGPQPEAPGGLTVRQGGPHSEAGGASQRGRGGLTVRPKHSIEHSNEQSTEHSTRARAREEGGGGDSPGVEPSTTPTPPPIPPAQPMPQDPWPEAPAAPAPGEELTRALQAVEAYLTTCNPEWGGSIPRRERQRAELRQLLRQYGAEVVEEAAASLAAQAAEGLEVVRPVGLLRYTLERGRIAASPVTLRRQARPGVLQPPVAPPASARRQEPPADPSRPERPASGHRAYSYDPVARLPTRWHDAADGGRGGYVLDDDWDALEAEHCLYTARPHHHPETP